MRRSLLTLTLASCLAQINSTEELGVNHTYLIYNPHFTAYAISSPDDHATYVWAAEMTGDEGHAIKNDSYSQTLDSNSPYSAWMVVEYDQATYVYNVGAQKFLVVGVTGGTQAAKSMGSQRREYIL